MSIIMYGVRESTRTECEDKIYSVEELMKNVTLGPFVGPPSPNCSCTLRKGKIQLKEIIWEITGRCNHRCDYCGSKDGWGEEINQSKIFDIANAIAEYPPEQIDISGGDPLLISFDTHQGLVRLLKEKGVMVKIIINAKSLLLLGDNRNKLDLYDWIGVSINNEEELSAYKRSAFAKRNVSIITNFNLENIFFFEEIKKAVLAGDKGWQIQLTTYREGEDKQALYKNKHALKAFFKMLQDAVAEGVKIIPADNINNSICGAGTVSIGICSNGDVVPCLSMRSWMSFNDFKDVVQGNVLKTPLRDIWMNQFINNRFNTYKSCKDHCGNCVAKLLPPVIKKKRDNATIEFEPKPFDPGATAVPIYGTKPYPPVVAYAITPPFLPQITMYAVSPYPPVVAYGVTPYPNITYYGVSPYTVMYAVWYDNTEVITTTTAKEVDEVTLTENEEEK